VEEGVPSLERGHEWLRFAVLALVAGLAMMLSLGVNSDPPSGATRVILHSLLALMALGPLLWLGAPLLTNAFAALRQRRIVTDHLFLLALSGALAASLYATWRGRGFIFYELVPLLLAIHRLGALLLASPRERLQAAWRGLAEELDLVHLVTPQGMRKVAVASLQPGDLVQIEAGEIIPVDGRIASGSAFVRESTLTGEPFPVPRVVGDEVSAGGVVLDAPLTVATARPGGRRRLDALRASVEALLEKPTPVLNVADRLVRWFLPFVLIVSLAAFAVWNRASALDAALNASLAVLLVACPCALGVALPMLFRLGLTRFVQAGLVVSSPLLLERLASIRRVVFDKTGSLAEPELTLASFAVKPSADAAFVRAILGAVQSRSDHPVAAPFVAWTGEGRGVAVKNLRMIPAVGLAGEVIHAGRSHAVEVGNDRLLNGSAFWAEHVSSKRTITTKLDGEIVAVATLEEELRPGALESLHALGESGYFVTVLTGDNRAPAILTGTGVEIRNGLSPEEKCTLVQTWEQQGETVLYLGDGLNDAGASAAASASLALGAAHPITAAASQAVWPRPHLDQLPGLLRTARALVRQGRHILALAFAYNTLGIAAAASGHLHPVLAAILMLASSLSVTTLAARAGAAITRTIGKREIDVYRNGLMFEGDHVVGVSKR
jgi:Cu+-exporting ATPase